MPPRDVPGHHETFQCYYETFQCYYDSEQPRRVIAEKMYTLNDVVHSMMWTCPVISTSE